MTTATWRRRCRTFRATASTFFRSVAPRVAVLPEAPLLDPRLARVADALDDLLGDHGAQQPVGASQRETA